jgi:hypothetical protein
MIIKELITLLVKCNPDARVGIECDNNKHDIAYIYNDLDDDPEFPVVIHIEPFADKGAL